MSEEGRDAGSTIRLSVSQFAGIFFSLACLSLGVGGFVQSGALPLDGGSGSDRGGEAVEMELRIQVLERRLSELSVSDLRDEVDRNSRDLESLDEELRRADREWQRSIDSVRDSFRQRIENNAARLGTHGQRLDDHSVQLEEIRRANGNGRPGGTRTNSED